MTRAKLKVAPILRKLIHRGRFLAYVGVRSLAEMLVPKWTIVALDIRARREVKRKFPEFDPFFDGIYNCAAHYEHLFDGRDFSTLTLRETASLMLVGRIGTAFYRLSADVRKGYGWDACGVAANLFELCWVARCIYHNEQIAEDWLQRHKAPPLSSQSSKR